MDALLYWRQMIREYGDADGLSPTLHLIIYRGYESLIQVFDGLEFPSFMGYLKGKSSVLIYEKFGDLKFKYRNREFWCRGYYVDTVGKNTKAIAEYIKHQLEEDKMGEQLTMLGKASDNPFTGGK